METPFLTHIAFLFYRYRFLLVYVVIGFLSIIGEIVLSRALIHLDLAELLSRLCGVAASFALAYFLNVRFNFKVPRGPGTVVINMLRRPEIKAWVDERPAESKPDAFLRVAVDTPYGARSLAIAFVPPWSKGWAVGFAMGILAAAVAWGTDRLNRSDPSCALRHRDSA